MDEKELEGLFRTAPGDPPPPGFTLTDVTNASARATARRRTALLAACACVVVLLGAAGIVGVTYFRGTESQSAQPAGAPVRPPGALSGPSPMQGSGGNGQDGPRAESTSGCDKVDRELATALAGELPATGVTGPAPGRVCTTNARSAGFQVSDGDRHGFVSVTVFPTPFAMKPFSDGTVLSTAETASGGSLVVLSSPDAGSAPPLESRLAQISTSLARHF
ncbi:hypothetical protein HFP15_23915 [Amycolatopsis sp. K13G38]|uniref:DUF3558 domain-containing protein n=1 Tax=Amycolatopsis acididurans TaxID=2724524 RepID=A0ABX1J877_9PSEU|nr:hypothetical protein [Amycolatopsis acididurans]NKQ55928.1 hypothetical protein [Amycolatopsis acididurans]